jgi:hypothetical protein
MLTKQAWGSEYGYIWAELWLTWKLPLRSHFMRTYCIGQLTDDFYLLPHGHCGHTSWGYPKFSAFNDSVNAGHSYQISLRSSSSLETPLGNGYNVLRTVPQFDTLSTQDWFLWVCIDTGPKFQPEGPTANSPSLSLSLHRSFRSSLLQVLSSHLLGRCSATWAIHSEFFVVVVVFAFIIFLTGPHSSA